jgi:hypothetical protein
MALLLYSGNAVATPGSPPVSATTAAAKRLDNANLEKLIDHFDLYPGMRKRSQDQAAAQMRAEMTLTQPDIYSLQIGFRDKSMENSQDVTNALAAMLESDVVMGVDTAAATTPVTRAKRPAKSPTPHTESNADKKTRLQRQVAQSDAQLQELSEKESALQQESALRQQKISALIHTQSVAEKPKEPVVIDPSAATRNSLKQQIATEKQRLAALRLRYTEAYPDVEDTRDRIADLEKKLSALPPAPRPETHQTLYQKQMDELTAEESELGARLRRNEEEMNALQRRRDWMKKVVLNPSLETAAALPIPAATANASDHKPVLKTVPLRPFRIVQAAMTSTAIKTSHPQAFLWVGLVTVVLLGLCLTPLAPRQDALIATAEMLKATLPAHVKFLGEIRRMEP